MNPNMLPPKKETGDLLLSITKNGGKFIKQTHGKAEETLEIKLNKSRKTFRFNPPIPIEDSWMIGLTNLEVYNYIFNITEENNKFELFNFLHSNSGGILNQKVKERLEETWMLQILQSPM